MVLTPLNCGQENCHVCSASNVTSCSGKNAAARTFESETLLAPPPPQHSTSPRTSFLSLIAKQDTDLQQSREKRPTVSRSAEEGSDKFIEQLRRKHTAEQETISHGPPGNEAEVVVAGSSKHRPSKKAAAAWPAAYWEEQFDWEDHLDSTSTVTTGVPSGQQVPSDSQPRPVAQTSPTNLRLDLLPSPAFYPAHWESERLRRAVERHLKSKLRDHFAQDPEREYQRKRNEQRSNELIEEHSRRLGGEDLRSRGQDAAASSGEQKGDLATLLRRSKGRAIKMSTAARRRLMRDFKRMQTDPPAGVSASPIQDNVMTWYVLPRPPYH